MKGIDPMKLLSAVKQNQSIVRQSTLLSEAEQEFECAKLIYGRGIVFAPSIDEFLFAERQKKYKSGAGKSNERTKERQQIEITLNKIQKELASEGHTLLTHPSSKAWLDDEVMSCKRPQKCERYMKQLEKQ